MGATTSRTAAPWSGSPRPGRPLLPSLFPRPPSTRRRPPCVVAAPAASACAAPRPPPRRAVPRLRARGSAAGRTARRGPRSRTPRGSGESRCLAPRAIISIIVCCCCLLCVVFVSGSCFRLLLSVVLRVGVVLLLVCHADSLFLPLFLSPVVSCACGFVCVRCCRLLLFVC